MKKYELGEKIKITSELARKEYYKKDDLRAFNTRMKEWKENPIDEIEVVVVGIRTLSNGHTRYEKEEGYIFYPEKYFRALLVVKNLNSKPFYTNII